MIRSAHLDTFAQDNLPPPSQWPELLFTLPALQYPNRLNCAAELLDAWVTKGHAGHPAIITPKRRLTYAELLAESNRIANVLRHDLRLVPGNRVLIRGYNNEMTAAIWFGVLKAGCIAVTTMPLLRAKELADTLTIANVSTAICDARLASELQAAAERCPMLKTIVYSHDDAPDALEARMARAGTTFDNVDTAATDVALIAFTSGTTGKPKGTMHFHRDVLAICDTFPPAHVGARHDDVFCGTPPLAFTFGLGGLLLFPLRAGATALLLESSAPDTLLSAIEEYHATICFAAPAAYRALTGLIPRFPGAKLRTCVSAGETLPVAIRNGWESATGVRIVDGIGATEMLHIFISASDDGIRAGATGTAVPGYVATVLDDEGRVAKPGTVGRLAVKGPTGCRYLADPRQADYVHDGWNVTGDAYALDDDGYFWFQARTDDMIIASGYNIAGPEVEGALLLHPSVAECAVVAANDEARGSIVKAFVVLREGFNSGDVSVRTLQEFVKNQIAPYKYPRAIDFVETLPRTETGKLQRFRLRDSGTADNTK